MLFPMADGMCQVPSLISLAMALGRATMLRLFAIMGVIFKGRPEWLVRLVIAFRTAMGIALRLIPTACRIVL